METFNLGKYPLKRKKMNNLILILLLIIQVLATCNANNNTTTTTKIQLELIYYPLMPFVTESYETRVSNGIIRLLFNRAGMACLEEPQYNLLAMRVNLGTREKLNEVVANYSGQPAGQGLLKDVKNKDMTVWGPFNVHPDLQLLNHYLQRSLKTIPILTSDKLAVIMQRSAIIIHSKLWNGVVNSKNILFFSTLFSVVVGTLFWFSERNANPNFKKPTGMGTAIYWSVVTMSTVGYGDVTPVTFIGRLLSLIWMVVGLMFASILTATLSDSVTGVAGLQIEDQPVAVLNNSFEHYTVKNDYDADVKAYRSYSETIEALRRGEVYAAVLPYEVAAWMQNDITHEVPGVTPLHIVYTLKGMVKFTMDVTENPLLSSRANEEFFECLERDSVIKMAIDLHSRNVFLESLYYGDLFTLSNSTIYSVMIGLFFAVIGFGIVLTFVDVYKMRKVQNKNDERNGRREKIEDTIRELNSLLKQYYKDNNNDKNSNSEGALDLRRMETAY